MKFKYLMISFITIIVFVIMITAFLPRLLAGPEFAVSFRYITLPLMLIMGFLLVFMTIFFLLNYRLFSLLEREDWPALSYYLEKIVYVKGKYNARRVRLLASSYLVITDYPSVLKLENKVITAKPSLIKKSALVFGAARVLSGDTKGAADFFYTYMDEVRKKERQWMHWFFGFCRLLSGEFDVAEKEFTAMAKFSNDALITGLCSYFLQSSVAKYSQDPDDCKYSAANGRHRVVSVLKTVDMWNREVNRMENEIHIAIIRKYINEARDWIYQ